MAKSRKINKFDCQRIALADIIHAIAVKTKIIDFTLKEEKKNFNPNMSTMSLRQAPNSFF